MRTIIAFIVVVLALQSAVQQAPTAIKGARVSLVPKPQAVLNITLENRRASLLVEWQIGLTLRGTGQPAMTHTTYQSIPPGERRTFPLRQTNPQDVATATLVFAAFEDGHYEGTAEAVQGWQKVRDERAKDLSHWVAVFGLMPRVSEPDLRRYLSERSIERAGQMVNDVSGVRAKLRSVLQRHPAGPNVWEALDRLRIETQAALARATLRPPDPTSGGIVDTVSSVDLFAQEQVTTTTYDVAIENLRSKAIEAVGFEDYDPATNRPRGGQTADLCLGDRQILPKEIREMFLGAAVDPNAPPAVRLTFVLFDDLSFEGSTAARDELLRHRETQADDYAYGITVIRQAAVLPPGGVEAFLVAKRAERARQLQSEGRRGETHMLEQLLREAKASPERFVAGAKVRADSVERARQRLLRHKAVPPEAK